MPNYKVSKKDLKRIQNSLNKYARKFKGHPLKSFGNNIKIETLHKHIGYEYVVHFNYEKRTVVNKVKATRKKKFPPREITNTSQVAPWSIKLRKRYFNIKAIKTIKVPRSSYHKTCTTCSGSKTVTCNDCRGQRNFSCSSCGEKGYVRCSCIGGRETCSNCSFGKTNCRTCGGSGQDTTGLKGVYSTCYGCNGSGKKTCYSCGGTTSVTCRNCSGTQQRRCYSCGGSGRVNCSGCRGSGYKKCYSCNGKGGFEHYIGLEQSFNKDSYRDYYIPRTHILKTDNVSHNSIKSENFEKAFQAHDFFNHISINIKYPTESIKRILQRIKNNWQIRTSKQKLTINSYSLIEFTYFFEGKSYMSFIIGKSNTLFIHSCPISKYALNQLEEVKRQLRFENYFESYKILKRINGLPDIEGKDVKHLETLIRQRLKLKKGYKYYKQKIRIKLHGKIK
ncbi:hypothetical protein [Flavivirga jejuensis]|uniref:Uncharacterized protein n=1 Tax=Flavivirga jejuensis TaxID=870487 RepID=A0ABT8WW33_9FLAO|nr:hypothetical protein [Flavivirga jejuensis]MDO5977082.1 hypothetical protein [Flavivirga jejuensis]